MGKSNVGTTLSISATAPATEDQAGYEALTFTQVGGVISVGEFGDSYEAAAYTLLETGRTTTTKGAVSGGTAAVVYIPDSADAGQIIVDAGLDLDSDYSFEVVRPDGLTEYMQGRIMSRPNSSAEASSVRQRTFSIAVNTATVEVSA